LIESRAENRSIENGGVQRPFLPAIMLHNARDAAIVAQPVVREKAVGDAESILGESAIRRTLAFNVDGGAAQSPPGW
jgi:hypothetical protein